VYVVFLFREMGMMKYFCSFFFDNELRSGVCVWDISSDKLTSLSSSSKVNSFFLTTLSWLRKLNSAAFFCNLANLFSYLETFLRVGLTLK
jgi:hypothetical protein